MKCPNCDNGDLTVIYENPKYIEFLMGDDASIDSFTHGEIYEIDFGDESRVTCTNGCWIGYDDYAAALGEHS